MDALEDRLLERFESGLVADITAPDLSTRLTILRLRAQRDRLPEIDPRALEVIADRVTDNIRALEGALIRVVAYHSLTGAIPTNRCRRRWSPTSSTSSIRETRAPRRATIRDIQELTCEAFGVTHDELVSPSRVARVAWPRQLAMYLRASSPTPPCRPSAAPSAAATTPPSSTPSARPASASPPTRAPAKLLALSPLAPSDPGRDRPD